MKRIALLIAMLVGLGGVAFGQGNSTTILFPGVPTGGCAFVMYAINGATGDLYDCPAGSWHPTGTSTGTGTVTTFSAGTLSPLFTTSVANASTAPALSFVLSNAAAHKVFMNNTGGSAAPGFQSIGTADLPAATVFNNQANTYTTGLQSFASATMGLPSAAGYAPTTAGLFGYDSTANRLVFGNGTTTGIPIWLTSAPTNGQCPQFSGTTGLVVSAACGGVTSISGDGTVITNSASTGAVTLTIAGTSGGIPYFSSTSAWHSSALLAANGVMIGGGAGTAPTTISPDATTTHALFATAGAPAFRAIVSGDLPTVAIAQGGTGQTTASAAFNALAPATATGGLIVGTGVNTYGNVAVGTAGQCLIVSGSTWAPGSCATGSIGGTGTTNAMAKFTAASTIGNSLLTDNATMLAYSGTGGLNLSAGPLVLTQSAAPTGSAGSSWLWADSVALRLQMKNGSNTAANVVASGVDINTSDQVTATHLSAALPVNQGGTGTTSTLTGIMRGSASAMTAAELSGDATTSGSNAVTVVALRNAALPTLAASTGLLYDTSGTLSLQSTLPTAAVPAFTGDATNSGGSLAMTVVALRNIALPTLAASTGILYDTSGTLSLAATLPTAAVPAFTGDMTNSSGSLATTVAKINGTAFSGTNGHLVSFGASNTPADSAVVAADVLTYHTPATGIARTTSATQAVASSELSGDATTSGSNVVTVVKVNGASVPSGSTSHEVWVGTALNTMSRKVIPDCNGSSNALNYTQSTDAFSCLSIATLSNPMSTLGDIIYGGAAGAVSRLAGPTSGNSPYTLISLPSGGSATAPTWSVAGVPVDTQSSATPTIAGDSAATPDRASVVLTTNNTTSTATSIAAAGGSGFAGNYTFVTCNTGSVINTITPTTSTVNGNTTVKLLGQAASSNPECAFFWSNNTNYFAAEILPTDANGRLQATGFPALTGDATTSAGSLATTVGAINGTAFSGTNGHLVSFGASNTPADSAIVAANVVTAASTLTSTALMTGAGTKTSQTPCATCTLSSGGALQLVAGGSIGSLDTGTPTLTFATNKATLSQPLVLGTTSNQLVTGTSTNLTTLTFTAPTGAITLTFPNTTEFMVGANSDTTTTHLAHATAVAGVAAFSALACADVPALTGDATSSAGSCATTVGKINGTTFTGTINDVVAFGTGGNTPLDTAILYTNLVTAASNFNSGGLVYGAAANKTTTSSADWAISTHTLSGGASAILDFHAASATAGFLPPSAAGAVPTTSGVVAFDSTAKDLVWGNGTNTSQAGFFTGAPTGSKCLQTSGTTGLIVETGGACGAGGAGGSLDQITGSATQVTATETGTAHEYTYVGVETGNLTTPVAFINGNSATNNTDLGLVVGAQGTSTGGIGMLVYDVSGTGDIQRWYHGGSFASGVYTVGTLEANLTNGGALTLNGALSATQLTSTISTGTAPLVVASTTQVANLNAATLGGFNLGTPVAGGIGYGVSTTQIGTTSAGTTKQIVLSGGTGAPTMIDFPERFYIPAANCNNATAGAGWNIGASGVVVCRAGTNNLGGAVQITDTAGTFAQTPMITIPVDWDTASNPFIKFYFSVVTDTTNGHTVIPQIKVSCPTAGNGTTSDDATFTAAQSSSTVTLGASAVANGYYNGSSVQIGSTQMTGCIAGGAMIVQIGRATDTVTGNVNFWGVDITFPRLLAVQAN